MTCDEFRAWASRPGDCAEHSTRFERALIVQHMNNCQECYAFVVITGTYMGGEPKPEAVRLRAEDQLDSEYVEIINRKP
jgi:hypothetical protein